MKGATGNKEQPVLHPALKVMATMAMGVGGKVNCLLRYQERENCRPLMRQFYKHYRRCKINYLGSN